MQLTAHQTTLAHLELPRVVLEAGPGSGKTTLLVARVAHLIRDRGARADEIRVFVFTRAAADELRDRIERELPGVGPQIDVTTFHAFALRVIAARRKRDGAPPLEVASEAEDEAYRRALMDPKSGFALPSRSRAILTRRTLDAELVRYEAQGTFGLQFVPLLIHRFRESRLIPRWALVPEAVDSLFTVDEQIDIPVARHLLVDELQDCTPNDHHLVRVRAGGPATVFAVGDPRQAIMGWRGATPMDHRLFGGNVATFSMNDSHRFGFDIATTANWIAARFGGANIVGLRATGGVAATKARAVGDIRCDLYEPRDTAILCRSDQACREIVMYWDLPAMQVSGVSVNRGADEDDLFAEARRQNKIAVSTIHAAKGREWDHVVIAPSWTFPQNTPEEWRCLYVAATRAKRYLTICGLAPHCGVVGD